jgi:hypothetical protein
MTLGARGYVYPQMNDAASERESERCAKLFLRLRLREKGEAAGAHSTISNLGLAPIELKARRAPSMQILQEIESEKTESERRREGY